MQIKELAEDVGFEVLHGIVDCLWVIGEPISDYEEVEERETGILTEVDSNDWITFLPKADGSGAYNCYFGRLDTGKMKIRVVMARKGDTPEYVAGCEGTCCSSQGRQVELLAKMCRGTRGAGISDLRITLDTRHENQICGD
jgi:DNA polymerase I